MVDEATASQIRELQRSVMAAQRDLSHSINTVQNDLDRSIRSVRSDIKSEVTQVGSRVESAIRLVNSLQTDLETLREQLTSYIKEERLARNMQFAKTTLIDIRAERDRKFGHHEALRRSVIGTLQAMDAGIVTESTLQQASERLMIDAPRYWLAPVQVALAAWIRNSRAVAERAVLEAMIRDPNKPALFFTLVLARHERYDASAQWMYEYVNQQDSKALSREFVVVLDAANQGALGERALNLLKERCISWYEQLRSYESISHHQVARWRSRIDGQRQSLSHEFHVLPHVCPDWAGTLTWLEGATVHGQSEQLLRNRFSAPIAQHRDLRYRIDSILRNLVTAYDEEEDPLLRAEARWQAVIDAGGNHTAAAPTGSTGQASTPDVQPDFLTLLTNIGLDPVKAGASVVTEQFAISLANEWIETAAQQLADDNMSERPEFIPVTIGGWVKDLHPGDNDITVSEDFRSFINGRTREEINKVTVSKQRLVLIGSLAIFAASALTFGFKEISEIFDLIFGGAAVLLLASASLWLIRAYRNLPGRKEYVRTKGEEQKEEGSGLIQAALSEIRKLYDLWDTEIAKKHSLVEFIHGEASRASQMPILALQAVTPEPGIASPPSPQQKPVNGSGKGGAADMADHDASTEPIALRLPKWDLLPPASRKP